MSSTSSEPCLALVDCNNFYVSCERVFRPDLAQVPVAVLSNNDGCVIARSEEVKQLGVMMGTPYFQCGPELRRAGAVVFSSNYPLYGDLSQRVMKTLEALCPRVERYSIDEAFVEIPGSEQVERETFSQQLQAQVLRDTGIPVSIGLATTKVLAKLANRQAKRLREAAGIWSMPEDPETRQQQLSATPLTDVWGIGRRWARRLENEGWQNAAELAAADPAMIRLVANVVLQRIALELRGDSCLSLEEISSPPRSLVRSRSFGQPLYQLTELRPALGRYLQRGWEHLRRHHLRASGIQVFLHTSRFHREIRYFGSRQAVIEPTDDLWELQRYAFALLEQAYRSGVGYTRCGVMLFGLEPDQPSWKVCKAWQQRADLQQAISGLQQRWGRDVIQLAHTLTATKGLPLQQHRSPRYTTQWSELAIVGKKIFF